MTAAELPLLLAGPIIRTVANDELWFWVATSQKVTTVEPKIVVYKSTKTKYQNYYDLDNTGANSSGGVPLDEPPKLFWDPGPFRCVKLGQNLYVTLIGVWPKARTFRTGVVLGYDLQLTLEDAKGKKTTSWLNQLTNIDDLKYPGYFHPTFYLPTKPSVLAQASCRRPGAGGPDAFLSLDEHCAANANDIQNRASALFLTGDQIYADDVAYSLFEAVRRLSINLMGYDEFLPNTYGRDKRPAFEVQAGDLEYTTPAVLAAAGQGAKINGQDIGLIGTRRGNIGMHGFTTDDGEGHLLAFGEFAAMYLLVWNPELAKLYGLEKNLKKSGWGGDQNLVGFTKAITAARRVLANTPTYMIFDDHEITDDWNINKKWVEGTDNLFARRVVANGLAAYWAFQAWGTNPSGYGTSNNTVIDLVEKHLDKQPKNGGRLYRFNDRDFSKPMLAWTDWSYVTRTNPTVVVADMRTHRRFKYRDEAHMDGDVAKRFENYLSRMVDHRAPLFLVVASPFLGYEPVLKVRKIALKLEGGALQKEVGDLFDDIPEGQINLVRLIKSLADPTLCVVFSGDVHFSHIELGWVRAEYKNKPVWQMPIVQITSSPLKNESADLNKRRFGFKQANLLEEAMPTKTSTSDYQHYPNVTLTWESQRLKGKLGYETVIPKNASCLVSLLGPKRLYVEYLGHKARAYCDLSI